MKRTALAILLTLLSLPVVAQDLAWSFDVRTRAELFETPSPNPTLDESYEILLLRGRFNVDWKINDEWTVHGTAQAAAMNGAPDDGTFGIGPAYYGANGESSPAHLGIAELWGRYKRDELTVMLGRMGYADGTETMTGVPYLDGVKRARIAERLIGNWDWVNVGRRYEGATLSWEDQQWDLTTFFLNPLAGGVNYDDAFDSLDDLHVWGISGTNRYGNWIPNGEIRGFFYEYDDERRGATTAAGASIDIRTIGAHALFGDAGNDFFVWAALQQGDWGTRDHEAWAAIAEAGTTFPEWTWTPTARVGAAIASGGSGNEHKTFFNMLPTNHKWYGAMDFTAFQNVQNVYLLAGVTPRSGWNVTGELHAFFLEDEDDAWYGGSGAFNEAALGYAGRRPAGGFDHSTIGYELDLTVRAPLLHGLTGLFGVSHFIAGSAGEQILTAEDAGSWLFAQVEWKR